MTKYLKSFGLLMLVLSVAACARYGADGELPPAPFVSANEGPGPDYLLGPLDTLNIAVWRNPELSAQYTVRPDGRFSMPMIDDLHATGKTPTELALAIEEGLSEMLTNPTVAVMVTSFRGPFAQQVRVVGEAAKPQAIAYQANMTLLDLMIQVGGLTEFAAGDRATLIRFEDNVQKEYAVRIESLIKDGDVKANIKILPGDVLIIPESIF